MNFSTRSPFIGKAHSDLESLYFVTPHPDEALAACTNMVLKQDLKVRPFLTCIGYYFFVWRAIFNLALRRSYSADTQCILFQGFTFRLNEAHLKQWNSKSSNDVFALWLDNVSDLPGYTVIFSKGNKGKFTFEKKWRNNCPQNYFYSTRLLFKKLKIFRMNNRWIQLIRKEYLLNIDET